MLGIGEGNFRRDAPWAVLLCVVFSVRAQATNSISLSTYDITVSGSNPNYSVNVGTIDGLGVGTPASNVNSMALSGGQLFWIHISVTLGFTSSGTFSVKVGTNYTHSSVQTAYFCHGGACNTVIPTAITTSYTTWASGLSNGTYNAYLGTQLMPTNGAGAFTGSDNVTLTFEASSTGSPATCNLTINLSAVNAMEFTLATSGAGLTVSSGSGTDFSAGWGNINGLGVGTPASGLTAYSVSGGNVYETPISLLPVFSSFSSTTGTLSVYVSSNFAHSSLLGTRDTGTSGGPYTTVSLTSASPTTMTSSATSGSTVTRYLGIFVSNQNGGSAFTGADDATLTYQLTVP